MSEALAPEMANLGKAVLVTLMRALLPGSTAVALLFIGGEAAADGYLCYRHSITYWIQVVYEKPGQKLPCSVYRRVLPEERKRLWRATKDPEFCKAKAEEIKQRLTGYGWLCQPVNHPSDETSPKKPGLGAVGTPVM